MSNLIKINLKQITSIVLVNCVYITKEDLLGLKKIVDWVETMPDVLLVNCGYVKIPAKINYDKIEYDFEDIEIFISKKEFYIRCSLGAAILPKEDFIHIYESHKVITNEKSES